MSNPKVSIQKLPKSQIELTVEIPAVDFDKYLEKAVENLAKNLEIKGFRKGSVPKEMAKNHLPQKDVLEEAINLAINATYPKAIEENKFEVIDSPKIEISKVAMGNPLIYKATVLVLPEVKLPDYKKIAKKINEKNKKDFDKKIKVEEKEIDDSLAWLQKSRAKYITVNREARVGDYVKIKLAPYRPANGGADAGSNIQYPISNINKAEEHEGVIGDGYFLPDFEKNLIGMKVGEKKSFSQQIPETHANKEMAGKTFDFEVDLNLVQEVKSPELNDEFAKSLAPLDGKHFTPLEKDSLTGRAGQGNFENLLSLRQGIVQGIKTQKEEKEKQRSRQELMDVIVKESEMEIPDILIERRVEREIHRLKDSIEGSGMNFDDYLKSIKKNEDDLKKDLRDYAQNQVKIALTLRQIAKIEMIKAGEEEINEKVNKYLQKSQNVNVPDIDQEQLKLYYEDAIRNEKTFQLLESCTNE